jgi:hypothetical protein
MNVYVGVQIKVEKEEVQRLLKLPCELQLALPFLHSPDQLHAHRLLMHYSFMKGTSIDYCIANTAPSGRWGLRRWLVWLIERACSCVFSAWV